MNIPKPVLVIHGVNTTSESEFEERVDSLRNKLVEKNFMALPVFWGDLGVNVEALEELLPKLETRRRSIAAWLVGGLWHLIAGYGLGSAAAVFNITRALGYMVAGDEEKAEELFEKISRGADEIADTGYNFWWEAFHFIRAPINSQLANFIGDVILYQHKQTEQETHQRILECIREVNTAMGDLGFPKNYGSHDNPITVIAHSLGGVIAFDMRSRVRFGLIISLQWGVSRRFSSR